MLGAKAATGCGVKQYETPSSAAGADGDVGGHDEDEEDDENDNDRWFSGSYYT